jgi:hypothetical protein
MGCSLASVRIIRSQLDFDCQKARMKATASSVCRVARTTGSEVIRKILASIGASHAESKRSDFPEAADTVIGFPQLFAVRGAAPDRPTRDMSGSGFLHRELTIAPIFAGRNFLL